MNIFIKTPILQSSNHRKFTTKIEKGSNIIKGVYPPIPTPFNSDGTLALDKLTANVTKLMNVKHHHFSGVVALGSNGEYPALGSKEKLQILETVSKSAKDMNSNKILIAGTGSNGTKDTIEVTKYAASLGFHAALVITPYYFRPQMSDEALITHFTKVADSSPIPILIYNVPPFTNLDISNNTVIQLASHPNIIGIKESSGNIVKIGQLVQQTKSDKFFGVFAGSGSYLLPALMNGAKGGIMALANVLPEQCAKLVELFDTKQFEKASKLQSILIPVNQAVTRDYGVPGLKWAVDRYNYFGGSPRLPLLPLKESQVHQLKSIFDKYDSEIRQFEQE